jgi:hypothetical protein
VALMVRMRVLLLWAPAAKHHAIAFYAANILVDQRSCMPTVLLLCCDALPAACAWCHCCCPCLQELLHPADTMFKLQIITRHALS